MLAGMIVLMCAYTCRHDHAYVCKSNISAARLTLGSSTTTVFGAHAQQNVYKIILHACMFLAPSMGGVLETNMS
jgi:hypothetical protein